jgi:hypothetical protein
MPEIGRLNIGVIVERREIDHPWQDHEWRVAELVPAAQEAAAGELIEERPDARRYFAGVGTLTLHTTDVDAYLHNLVSPRPSIYVVLRSEEDLAGAVPFRLDLVTANPYDAEAYMEGDGTLIAARPMPAAVKEWIEAFVAAHHKAEPFRKRQRTKIEIEAHTFGQEPIFELRKRLKGRTEDEID